jgi:hypothetical protein
MSNNKIIIQNDEVTAISPEGVTASMKLNLFFEKLLRPKMDTGGVVLPDCVKSVISRGHITICVCQIPPRVYSLSWIAKDSKALYGKQAKYRIVRIALPYIYVLAVFSRMAYGRIQLTHKNECFFRNEPLNSLNDELLYPALLNCSKFSTKEGNPLSWICTQYLDLNLLSKNTDTNQYIRASISRLLSCLWETGFNWSSEKHEGNSWFSETVRRSVDSRISSIEEWQKATEKDPLFVLDIPWLRTGKSVKEITDRIFGNFKIVKSNIASTSTLARFIFNSKKPKSKVKNFKWMI